MTDVQQSPWFRLILFMIANLLIVIMAPVSYSLFTGELLALVATAVFFLTFILMYVVTWVFVRWDGGRSIEELGVTVDQRFGQHVTFGAIAGTISAILVVVIAFFFGGQLRPFNEITGDLIVNEIIITAPTAFFEELVYRGYILTRMERLTGKRAAIFLSSTFFALLHFTWWAEPGFPAHLAILFTFNMFLGGVVLSFSYYWSNRRLWVPIAFHFMWNMIAYIMFPTFPRELVSQPELFQIEWGITTVVGFLLGHSILWSFLSTEKNKE